MCSSIAECIFRLELSEPGDGLQDCFGTVDASWISQTFSICSGNMKELLSTLYCAQLLISSYRDNSPTVRALGIHCIETPDQSRESLWLNTQFLRQRKEYHPTLLLFSCGHFARFGPRELIEQAAKTFVSFPFLWTSQVWRRVFFLESLTLRNSYVTFHLPYLLWHRPIDTPSTSAFLRTYPTAKQNPSILTLATDENKKLLNR